MKNIKTLLTIGAMLAIFSNAHAQSLKIINYTNFTVEFLIYANDGSGCDYKSYFCDIYASSSYKWPDPCQFISGCGSGPAQAWYLSPVTSYVSSCPTLPSGFYWADINFFYEDGCTVGFTGTLWDGTYGCN